MLLMQMDPFFWGVVIFCIIMFGLAVAVVVQSIKRDQKATEEVVATIVDVNRRFSVKMGPVYIPVYQYTYDGVDYEVISQNKFYGLKSNVKIGKEVILKIDPNNPEHVVESLSIKDLTGHWYFLFAILAIVGLPLFWMFKVLLMLLGVD